MWVTLQACINRETKAWFPVHSEDEILLSRWDYFDSNYARSFNHTRGNHAPDFIPGWSLKMSCQTDSVRWTLKGHSLITSFSESSVFLNTIVVLLLKAESSETKSYLRCQGWLHLAVQVKQHTQLLFLTMALFSGHPKFFSLSCLCSVSHNLHGGLILEALTCWPKWSSRASLWGNLTVQTETCCFVGSHRSQSNQWSQNKFVFIIYFINHTMDMGVSAAFFTVIHRRYLSGTCCSALN